MAHKGCLLEERILSAEVGPQLASQLNFMHYIRGAAARDGERRKQEHLLIAMILAHRTSEHSVPYDL